MRLDLLTHVLQAERRLADGEARIAALVGLIDRLRDRGLDTTPAEQLLELFRESRYTQIVGMSRLIHEVSSTTTPRLAGDNCPAFRRSFARYH